MLAVLTCGQLEMLTMSRMRLPKEIILVCIRWYAAYALSYRDFEEMMQERGVAVDHSTSWSDENHVRDIDLNTEAGAIANQFLHALSNFADQERVFQRHSLSSGALSNFLESLSLLVELYDSSNVLL